MFSRLAQPAHGDSSQVHRSRRFLMSQPANKRDRQERNTRQIQQQERHIQDFQKSQHKDTPTPRCCVESSKGSLSLRSSLGQARHF